MGVTLGAELQKVLGKRAKLGSASLKTNVNATATAVETRLDLNLSTGAPNGLDLGGMKVDGSGDSVNISSINKFSQANSGDLKKVEQINTSF